ncbi:MAG: DUF4870 domain-containing protein [Pyrinomonadaceae bacterium]
MQNQKSAIGLDANITALIGYPIGILALVLIFIEKENKFVRFHAIQSVLWSVALTVLIILIAIVGTVIGLVAASMSETLAWAVGAVIVLIYFGAFIGLFAGIIYGAVKAYGGSMAKLPFVGGFAEKWS